MCFSQQWGTKRHVGFRATISHLKRREPRLGRLQKVGQEVDGACHACHHKRDIKRIFDTKAENWVFWDVYLQTGRRECLVCGIHVSHNSCTSQQTADTDGG